MPYVFGIDVVRRNGGSRLVTLRSADHFDWIHVAQAVPATIEEFVTGRVQVSHDDDRILPTLVFTDIMEVRRTVLDVLTNVSVGMKRERGATVAPAQVVDPVRAVRYVADSSGR